jgi:hypothetical protein
MAITERRPIQAAAFLYGSAFFSARRNGDGAAQASLFFR